MFRHTRGGEIRIGEVVYNLAEITAVAPWYNLPAGMSHAEIDSNPRVFDEHGNQFAAPKEYLKQVGDILARLPQIKASRIAREEVAQKMRENEERDRLAALPLDERRQLAYSAHGITPERLILAFVQKEFDGDNREILALKKERDAVRARDDFPRARTKKITRE